MDGPQPCRRHTGSFRNPERQFRVDQGRTVSSCHKGPVQAGILFDMVCYVELSLDLKIEKQSYMLLRQSGFEGEAMGKTLEEHLAKKAELASLKKRIGKTGLMVLAPMVS